MRAPAHKRLACSLQAVGVLVREGLHAARDGVLGSVWLLMAQGDRTSARKGLSYIRTGRGEAFVQGLMVCLHRCALCQHSTTAGLVRNSLAVQEGLTVLSRQGCHAQAGAEHLCQGGQHPGQGSERGTSREASL